MNDLDTMLVLDRCPHCRTARPTLTLKTSFNTNSFNNALPRKWGFYICSRCGGVTTLAAKIYGVNLVFDAMFPARTTLDDAIPERAKHFLQEAIDCLHSPSSSILASASAIDAMLKAKGLKEGKLYSRIEKAKTEHLITDEMASWAHEVRLEANDERHADMESELPSEDEAKRMVDFAMALADFLFILPSRVQRGIKESKPVEKPQK